MTKEKEKMASRFSAKFWEGVGLRTWIDAHGKGEVSKYKADLIKKIEELKPTLEQLGEKGSFNNGYDFATDDVIQIIQDQ